MSHRGYPPPKTIVGKGEIYHWENRVGPFLVHTLLGPRPPPLSDTPPPFHVQAPAELGLEERSTAREATEQDSGRGRGGVRGQFGKHGQRALRPGVLCACGGSLARGHEVLLFWLPHGAPVDTTAAAGQPPAVGMGPVPRCT